MLLTSPVFCWNALLWYNKRTMNAGIMSDAFSMSESFARSFLNEWTKLLQLLKNVLVKT